MPTPLRPTPRPEALSLIHRSRLRKQSAYWAAVAGLAVLLGSCGGGGDGGANAPSVVADAPASSLDATSTAVRGEERLAVLCSRLYRSDIGLPSADWGPRTPPRYATNPANWHTGIDCVGLSSVPVSRDPSYKEPIDPRGKSEAEINRLLRERPSAAFSTPVTGWIMVANGRGAQVPEAGYACADISDSDTLRLAGNPIVIYQPTTGRTFLMKHGLYHATKAGAYVSAGEPIGFEGNVGMSSGIHLHFEVLAGRHCNGATAYTGTLDPVEAVLSQG